MCISEPRFDESIDGPLSITLEIAQQTSVLDLQTMHVFICLVAVELPLSTYLIIKRAVRRYHRECFMISFVPFLFISANDIIPA